MCKIDSAQHTYVLLDQQQAFLVEPNNLTGNILRMRENKHMWILVDANSSPMVYLPNFGS